MSISLLFWVIMILAFLFNFWSSWPLTQTNGKGFGVNVIVFILLALLGWEVFGAAVHK